LKFDNRITKLERVDNPTFIVRFPDKECEHGEETYDKTPIPDGCLCVVDFTCRDMRLA